MRLWSLHPAYLDAKGLVALWREALLAKHVLEGKTRGYKNHPQLDRFKTSTKPLDAIDQYLAAVHTEAASRSYHFNQEKINWKYKPARLTVTQGQIEYEIQHLLKKLCVRDEKKYKALKSRHAWEAHPLFTIIEGKIEHWEII